MIKTLCRATVFAAAAFALDSVGFAGGHAPASEPADAEGELALDVQVRGVDLGEYKIRAYYPVEAQKSTIWFVLHAAVSDERMAEAQQIVEARRHKLRDEVITATRMAPLSVFDEPGLMNFRRRILVRLRRTLPELPIDDIYVSDFQLTVKSL